MPLEDVIPEIVLLVGALAVVLWASFRPRSRQSECAIGALVVTVAAAGSAIVGLRGSEHLTFSGAYAVDGSTGWGRLLIIAATGLSVCLTPDWFRTDRRHGEYYGVLLLSALGAVLLAGASDTMELVVAMLLSSLTGYTLAAYHRQWKPSLEAAMKFFLIGAFANVILLVGVVLLFGLVGETGYAALGGLRSAGPVAAVAVTAVVIGISFEIAAAPAHVWMPDVAQAAPAPAAAFLTVVPKIGATIALARFLDAVSIDSVDWRLLVALLATASMTIGNLAALRQKDVRRLLGWSTVAQSGYALVAVVVLGRAGAALESLLFFLMGYAVANLAAFAAVTQLRGRTSLAHYAGISRARPGVAAVLVVAFLSLVGIPPLAGFVGKFGIFLSAVEGGYAWLAVVAVLNTVVSLFYYLRVLAAMYFAEPRAPVAVLGSWSATAMYLAASSVVVLGLCANPLLAAFANVSLLP